MKQIKYILIISIIGLVSSCDVKNSADKEVIIEKCPCDSIGQFIIEGKDVIYAYLGKSQIEIKKASGNDTIEVTRFYTTDPIWHIQEYLAIANDKIVDPVFAIYCVIKDTANFYKLTYNMNSELERNPDLKFVSDIGVEAIINNDTIRSNTFDLLITKEKFHGIIKFVKRSNVLYKGKKEVVAPFMFLEAETMIKYGNLLEQYMVISKYCK